MAVITKTEVIVRSTDCGPTRRIQSHRYFTYFEQGRLQHLRDIGVMPKERISRTRGRTFTIAGTTGRFLAPGYYPSTLTVRTRTSEVRNRSFSFAYEIFADDDGRLVAEGSSAQVWLDEEGRPAPFSEEVREVLMTSWDGAVKDISMSVATKATTDNHPTTDTPISVRYYDLDGDEIVNNSNYFVFFEHGRLGHLRKTGVLPENVTSREIALAFTIDEATTRFRVPVRFPSELVVRTNAAAVQGSSFSFEYQVLHATDLGLVADGFSRHTWLNEEGQPADVPAAMRTALLANHGPARLG